jgi:hypothetical protein
MRKENIRLRYNISKEIIGKEDIKNMPLNTAKHIETKEYVRFYESKLDTSND